MIFYENVFPYKFVNQHIQPTDNEDRDLNFLFDDTNNCPKDIKVDNQILPRTNIDDSKA